MRRKGFRENAEKERRIEGIGIELVNGDDRRAMLAEKKCEVILIKSSMAEEKTLKENEEDDEDIYLPFFRVIFFSLSSPPEKAINRKRFGGTKRFFALLIAYGLCNAFSSLLQCTTLLCTITYFFYLFISISILNSTFFNDFAPTSHQQPCLHFYIEIKSLTRMN